MMTALGQLMHGGGGSVAGIGSPCTILLEKEVIFGGLGRLRETIDGTIEVFEGQLYFVLTGCASGIIGDDVGSVVAEYADKGIPITFAETSGFRGDAYAGYDYVVSAMLENYTEAVSESEKEPFTVNIFGIVPSQDLFWHGNLREIKNLLAGIGVKANVFFGIGQDSLAEFKDAAKASLNIVLSSWIGKSSEQLFENTFGTKSLRFDSYPVGPTETTKFLRAVAGALGIDKGNTERYIDAEESYVYDFYQGLSMLSSMRKHVGIAGDVNSIVAAMRFLVNDFSQIPELAIVTDGIPDSDTADIVTKAIQDLETAKKPDVVFEIDNWKIRQIFEQYRGRVTQLLGSQYERLVAWNLHVPYAGLTFPNSDIMALDRAYAGYRGSLTFIEDVFRK
jgi:nitrogenase molybdenum-iron protein beta chain